MISDAILHMRQSHGAKNMTRKALTKPCCKIMSTFFPQPSFPSKKKSFIGFSSVGTLRGPQSTLTDGSVINFSYLVKQWRWLAPVRAGAVFKHWRRGAHQNFRGFNFHCKQGSVAAGRQRASSPGFRLSFIPLLLFVYCGSSHRHLIIHPHITSV